MPSIMKNIQMTKTSVLTTFEKVTSKTKNCLYHNNNDNNMRFYMVHSISKAESEVLAAARWVED